jgi:hypothetical protein
MFEFGREIKRLFETDAQPRDGLTGGDASLLEVLDIGLLRSEARAADIAAGRISAKDPHKRRLEAARVWRELARRTGDADALSKAALAAEKAAEGFRASGRSKLWAAARAEQGQCAVLGADLYGDDGLNAAAVVALTDAVGAAPSTPTGALAAGQLARLGAAAALRRGDYDAAKRAAATFDDPIARLAGHLRGRAIGKAASADLRCDRAELLIGCAARLKDTRLYEQAIIEMDRLSETLDSAYEPLVWSRVQVLRAAARVGFGETCGRMEDIAEGVELLVAALDALTPDHSPLDWARLQQALAQGLHSLGEGSDNDRAFEHALSCYERALWITRRQPTLLLRAGLIRNRANCLARRAELSADLGVLDDTIDELRMGLGRLAPAADPVGWASAQVDLAQLYIARLELIGADADRAAAGVALSTAVDVFGEHGLRSLTEQAVASLDRLARV